MYETALTIAVETVSFRDADEAFLTQQDDNGVLDLVAAFIAGQTTKGASTKHRGWGFRLFVAAPTKGVDASEEKKSGAIPVFREVIQLV